MTLHQEAGYERLYTWSVSQVHSRNVDSDISGLVQLAMNKLQDRPVLFKYVIDEYANARRSVFVRNFIDALTVGGPNSNPKPIEMHSHDPKRYLLGSDLKSSAISLILFPCFFWLQQIYW